MARNAPYLLRRNNLYSFRMAVPAALQTAVGCREITASLGVSDIHLAIPLALELAAVIKREFFSARNQAFKMDDKTKAVLSLVQEKRKHLRAAMEVEELQAEVTELKTKHAAELKQAALEAEVKTLRSAVEKLGARETKPLEASPSPASKRSPKHSLSELLPKWQKMKGARASTMDAYGHAVKRFEAQFPGLMVEEIERKHIRDYVGAMLDGGKAAKTIERDHGAIRALLNIAIHEEWIGSNPASRTMLPKTKPSKEPRSYTIDEVREIFSSPVFAAGKRPIAGKGDASYWLPILMLLTGARREEIAQLSADRILSEQGVLYLAIDPIDDDGSLKNDEARRAIPLHPELIKLGFLDFVKACKKTKEKSLFPLLKANKRGQYAAKWGDWWRRYIRKELKLADKNISPAHSFRHLFITECRRLRFREDYERALVGHIGTATADSHDQYGEHLVPALVEEIRRMDFRGLDLSHLYPKHPVSTVL